MKQARWASSGLGLILGWLLMASASLHLSAAGWKFAVLGDTRCGGETNDFTSVHGVRTAALRPIAEDIVRKGVDLVVFSGDLSSGRATNGTLFQQWTAWTNAMAPVYAAHIPVYPIRGNHELGQSNSVAVWRELFRDLPQNGPAGQEGLTFSFEHKGATFIGFDQFIGKNKTFNAKKYDSTLNSGMISPWVIQQIREARTPWVFAYAHESAFIANHLDCLANVPYERDEMWEALAARRGGGVYLAGHDHMYVNRIVTGPSGLPVRELVVGCGGAPFYTYGHAETNRWIAPKFKIEEEFVNAGGSVTANTNGYPAHYGYLLMTVNRRKLRGEWRALTNFDLSTWSVSGQPKFRTLNTFEQKASSSSWP